MTEEQKIKIKNENEALIELSGYKINSWLPLLDSGQLRNIDAIKGRLSVMTAMLNIAFNAPINVIKDWIFKYGLEQYLSSSELNILEKENHELTDSETNSLRWYLESIWALLWISNRIDYLDPKEHVGNNMAAMLPNLQKKEGNDKIETISSFRSEAEIYQMLDYYFRLHWYCVNERLHGQNITLNEGLVNERRKALEWVFNKSSDWDDVDLST